VEKYGTARQASEENIIWRMRFVFWVTKAADTHSEYVIRIAFPRQQWPQFYEGPAADATDAPQPWGLLCNPVMKIISLFFAFPCTGGMKLTGENRRTRGKTCRSATSSTTNPTWTDPGSNPGLLNPREAVCH
jgi:hypothetical protein